MDVIVKVVLDQKEYDRLLEIERKYNQLENISSHQKGAGERACECQDGGGQGQSLSLSQIIAENSAADAVERPIAGILPAITTVENEEDNVNTTVKGSGKTQSDNKTPKKQKKRTKKSLTFDSLTEKEKEELGFPRFIYPWYYIGSP